MLHIKELIVVEGKYDKEHLKKITDAPIICTHGFELYKSKNVIKSIKELSKDRGVIILTDSDRAGFRIRNYLKNCLGDSCDIKNAYIPEIEGKEKRKTRPGKDGILGVEGIEEEVLEEILKKAATEIIPDNVEKVTKADFFADGFSGREDSGEMRKQLAKELNLPPRISANAMLDLINQIGGMPVYERAIEDMKKTK